MLYFVTLRGKLIIRIRLLTFASLDKSMRHAI